MELEEDILLDLELGASGVDKGLRRCGDGGDQEGQELRWYYVRLKSATPLHGRISPAGRTTRLQVVRYNENHQVLSGEHGHCVCFSNEVISQISAQERKATL